MKNFIKDLFTFRKGRIVDIAVYDSFSGKVKIIKNRFYKWLIEIVDVNMCYFGQEQLKPGERMWIYSKEVYRGNKPFMITAKWQGFDYEDDLPF